MVRPHVAPLGFSAAFSLALAATASAGRSKEPRTVVVRRGPAAGREIQEEEE